MSDNNGARVGSAHVDEASAALERGAHPGDVYDELRPERDVVVADENAELEVAETVLPEWADRAKGLVTDEVEADELDASDLAPDDQ